MEFFLGNIDINNMQLLKEASVISKVLFKQGSYNSFSLNHKKLYDFHPIFCVNKEQSIILLKAYIEISKNHQSSNSFENDSYVNINQVLN